jgi:PAS domain S-box-containing protein
MTFYPDDAFSQRLQSVFDQTQHLCENARALPWQSPQLLIECLENLRLSLEELQVAEEELREQQDALITAQRTIEAERQRYRDLFEFAPNGYLITDLYGIVQEANQAAASLFDVAPNYLIRKPLISFATLDQRRMFRTILYQLPKIDRLQEWELMLRRRNGLDFHAAITVEVVRNQQAEAIGLRWLVRDITARKQAEEQMRQIQLQNLELLELDRLRSQFMTTISHELRTPMNAIIGFSELLLRRFHHQLDPQLTSMVERIARNGKHLLVLIEEILDFSKLKAKRLTLNIEEFDLVELITATIEELRPLAEQKGLDLTSCLTQLRLPVANDRTRLRQVLTNLVSNAIKFTDAGHVVVEAGSLPEARVFLTVRDTGIGIAAANQPQIFQEFWQVNQTSIRPHGGTGLGLAIVYALVQLMQGTISVDSQIGQGSSFRVELPSTLERKDED